MASRFERTKPVSEQDKEKAKTMKISPAIPLPVVFNVQERIEQLRGYLDPKNPNFEEHEQQHDNIRTVIKLYEEGKIDGSQEEVYVRDGKIITEEEMWTVPGWTWCEEAESIQMAQKFQYDRGSFGRHHHQLRMLVRLPQELGGDGTTHGIEVLNDTGSAILSLFDSDLQHLGNMQGYLGWLGNVEIRSANGTLNSYRKIRVEVSLLRGDNTVWSDWISERAIVKPSRHGVPRLSGAGMRRDLYFGTAPGNNSLAVATTKGGLCSLL